MNTRPIALIVCACICAVAPAMGAVRVSFDAAAAGVGVDPTGVSPAWTGYGIPMTNTGAYLLQDNTTDNPTQESGEYLSPSAGAGLMTHGSGYYGIEFRVRPLTDVAFIGSHWPELYLTWSDNTSNYNVTIDLDADDAGPVTTGSIVYGQNSFSPAITGIDWSVPHTIFIGYRGSSDVFDFFLDGVLKSTVVWGSIARSGSFAQDAVDFGDGTTGANDVAAEWYFVRIHDVAFPPPVSGSVVMAYDAAAAGAGVDPSGVSPAWTRYGTPMVNNGSYLLQDNTSDDPATQSGEYLSPLAGGLMRMNNSTYGIEFRVRPLTDVPFLGGSHFANLYLTWSDDTYNYMVTVDKDTDDAGGGTTGGIRYGGNSMASAVTGIDWSVPHTIFIGYRGFGSAFDFYVDNVLKTTVTGGNMARVGSWARDAVDFGDGTTGQGIDVAAEWYFVKVHNTYYPDAPIPTGLLREFNAATSTDPESASPAWQRYGSMMTGNGTFLLQDNTADDPTLQSGEYVSPPAAGGLMKLGAGQYGIEFKIRPLTDVPNLGYSHYANLYVTWSDDSYNYNVTIDKDTDDAGPETTGGLRYGKDSMVNVVSGIDWSVPHKIYIGYRGDALPYGEFDFYVDKVLKATVGAASMARSGSWARDSVDFGDGTTGQPLPDQIDVAAEWYFVRIYGSAGLPVANCPTPFADVNRDTFVDMGDYAELQRCLTASGPVATECECFDRENGGEGNGQIDAADVQEFAACASGPGIVWAQALTPLCVP